MSVANIPGGLDGDVEWLRTQLAGAVQEAERLRGLLAGAIDALRRVAPCWCTSVTGTVTTGANEKCSNCREIDRKAREAGLG